MAKQTYAQIQKQIATLEAQAAELKSAEVAGVIAKIKEAIKAYGLTPQDLYGGKAGKTKSKSKLGRVAKYADGDGNEWVGRGPRPQWLRDALDAGKSLEDFAVGFAGIKANGAAKPAVKKAGAKKGAGKKASTKKQVGKTKYGDGAGNSWSGFGRQPRWLKQAIVGGKELDDFKV